jgi:hypothetical protein
MASNSICKPPCINYSLNYNSDMFKEGELPEYIYKQYEDCKEKDNCKTAPLLNENGEPFYTSFGTKDSELVGEEAYVNNHEKQKFEENNAFTPDWDGTSTVYLSSPKTNKNHNFSYPTLKALCNVEYNVSINDKSETQTGQTICLMDYMNEYLKEYNKTLCVNIHEKDLTSTTSSEICEKYDNNTKHEYSAARSEDGIKKYRVEMGLETFQDGNDSEKTKEDQLKKDFVKMYNDNLFEIFTVSLAILVTAYLIKKY